MVLSRRARIPEEQNRRSSPDAALLSDPFEDEPTELVQHVRDERELARVEGHWVRLQQQFGALQPNTVSAKFFFSWLIFYGTTFHLVRAVFPN